MAVRLRASIPLADGRLSTEIMAAPLGNIERVEGVLLALRSRPRVWEFVALAGLGASTVQSGRSGVWLALFAAAWPDHQTRHFAPVLARSLAWICAYADERPVGFVNLAWDGGSHAFVLDTTVDPRWRRYPTR